MKEYKLIKKRIQRYIEKPNYNQIACNCDLDSSIQGIIDECRNILDLQDIVKTLSKSEERKGCKTAYFRKQLVTALNLGLNIRYEYLEQFIKNIKQLAKEN